LEIHVFQGGIMRFGGVIGIRRERLWRITLAMILWIGALPALAEESGADDNDVSLGITRVINIDEASIETAFYLISSIDNDFSGSHLVNLEFESTFAFNKISGLELDFPQILLQQPLGQGPSALGPINLGFRYVYYQFGTADSGSSGIFSLEPLVNYWASPNDQFPGIGDSFELEALGGLRLGKVFLQGNYGYNTALDSKALNGWFANTALGCSLDSHWLAQVEADFNGNTFLGDGSLGTQWTLVPQIGFKTGNWLFELGEAFNPSQEGTATNLIIEREL
jgi:hypothetical protein